MPDFVVRTVQEAEFPIAAELIARTMAYGSQRRYERRLTFWREHLPQRPGWNWHDVRVGLLNGQIVSAARLTPRTLEYGRARLKITVLSEISTDEAYRGQGFASQVVRDTLTASAELGAQMVLLLGKSGYYDRFGFSPLLPRYTLDVPTAHAAKLKPTLTVRAAEIGDLAQMAALYYRHWRGRVTALRTMESWLWRYKATHEPVLIAQDDDGVIQGYLWRDDHRSDRVEVVAETPSAVRSFLAVDGQQQTAAGQGSMTWSVPPDDLIVLYARSIVPVRVSAHYYPDGGWMARLIDSQGFVNTILPELNAQLGLAGAQDDLSLTVQPDGVIIRRLSQPDETVTVSLRDFMQLVFGSLRPAELAIRQVMPPSAQMMLEQIFPPRMAALAPWDWE